MRIFTLLTFRTKKSEHFYFVQTNCKVNRVAQTERNDWHNSTETGGIVYSETVALLMRRMQFSLFEQFGEVITDDLSIQISKDIISFEIIESKDTITHSLTKEEAQRLVIYNDEVKRRSYVSKPKIPKYDYVPNGIFKIKLSNGKYIKDTKTIKLEDMIPETAILFYQCYFEIRNKREEYEKAQVIWEEQRRKAKELQDYINLEKVKTRDFLNILSDFKLANEIREFACVLKDIGKTDEETLQWILNKANWIDPTISMEDDLLGKRDHHKSKEEKDAFLKETRHYW